MFWLILHLPLVDWGLFQKWKSKIFNWKKSFLSQMMNAIKSGVIAYSRLAKIADTEYETLSVERSCGGLWDYKASNFSKVNSYIFGVFPSYSKIPAGMVIDPTSILVIIKLEIIHSCKPPQIFFIILYLFLVERVLLFKSLYIFFYLCYFSVCFFFLLLIYGLLIVLENFKIWQPLLQEFWNSVFVIFFSFFFLQVACFEIVALWNSKGWLITFLVDLLRD